MQGILFPLLAIAMAALIAYLSLVPGDSKAVGWMPPWLQNVGHVGCYAVLGFMSFVAVAPVLRSGLAQGAVVLVVTTGFGVLMEWLQGGVPGRHRSLLDALQNALGVLIGIAAAVLLPT